MITRDVFDKEFSAVLASLEFRRKRYLNLFYIGAGISLLLVFVSLAVVFSIVSIRTSDIFSIIFFALFCSSFLLLTPIYSYRGSNKSAALKTFSSHRFSLKDEAYSNLFKLFGSFEFAPRGGVSLVEINRSTLFSEEQLYLSEDFVVGQLNDVAVKLCEANIAKIEHRKRISIFKGLLIVLDISDIKVKLRGDFVGRTALIYDPQKTLKKITDKYDSLQKFPLPEKFESVLEGYTSDIGEANSIITSELLENIDAFARKIQGLKWQVEHWDDKLAYAVAETYDYSKDKLMSVSDEVMSASVTLTAEPEQSKLPSDVVYDKKNEVALDITKADKISNEISSLNNHFELEFYEDKFVVTIPCKFDLFETNSIFEPALNSEDADILYALMQTLDKVTQHLNQVKSTS
jgi:hypothetical protein